MCWFAWGSFSDRELLGKISKSLHMRAKQKVSHYISDDVSFFHAPLKISDRDLDTNQPYVTQDCVVGLVWEIYNKDYLCTLVDIKDAAKISEVELIEKCYAKLGITFADYLNGEFTIFIFDKNTKKYYLFRDRYGVHAVYYTVKNNHLYFSSLLQDLKNLPSDENENISSQWIIDYSIFQFTISPHTVFSNILVLEPGKILEFQKGVTKKYTFWKYKKQEKSNSFIETLEQSVIRRIPYFQERIFMPISGWADSNLVLYFLQKHFKWEIITYTFSNKDNSADVQTAAHNTQKYGLKHLVIETNNVEDDTSLKDNIWLHEWLVDLYNTSGKLRELYPEYDDIHVEFSWDGREELLRVNTHFNNEEIIKKYQYFRRQNQTKEYFVDKDFLNIQMFDFNLQLIEKITLWNLIERRIPFTDYELLEYTWYTDYSVEAREFLEEKWIKVVSWIYGHNTWIYFRYVSDQTKLLQYLEHLISLK